MRAQVALYNDIVNKMYDRNEEKTVANFNERIGIKDRKSEKKEMEKRIFSPTSFIDFMREELAKEKIVEGTRKHTKGTIDAIGEFGKLNRFADLTPKNVKAFDEAMRSVVTSKGKVRTDTTVDNYHKVLKKYARLAYEYDYIEKNPYEHPMCHFKKEYKISVSWREIIGTPSLVTERIVLSHSQTKQKRPCTAMTPILPKYQLIPKSYQVLHDLRKRLPLFLSYL